MATTSAGRVAAIADSDQRTHSRSRTWMLFRRHKLALGGSFVLILLTLIALLAPVITTHDPLTTNIRMRKAPPSAEHWLGTDTAGRDMWARLAFAGRISLTVGVAAVSIYIVIGTVLGALAGYFGGLLDMIIMRITDMVMSFPSLIIIITVVSFVGPSIYNVMLVIGLLGWPSTCRLVRGQVLQIREMEFVTAAQCIGASHSRIIFSHIFPAVVPYLTVVATLGMAGAILTEASLSFLGLGVQPPTPSWGNMLNDARNLTLLEQNPHLWLPPGIMIALTILSINFVGDGLRDALDPRMIV